jgi:FkbM family methyltransferase
LPKLTEILGRIRIKTILVDSKHGSFQINHHDTIIGRSLKIYGEYAEHEMMLLSKLIEKSQTVVDVGANIGTHTVFFANKVGEKGAVIAIEAQPEIFNLLKKNIILNDLKNVDAKNLVIASENYNIKLPAVNYDQDGNFGALSFKIKNIDFYLPIKKAGIPSMIPAIPLDDLRLNACHLLKVDVEGMEKEVIDGAVNLIEKYRPILYLENNHQASSPKILQLLMNIDYQSYWHVVSYFRPKNFNKYNDNIFSASLELNLLCRPIERNINTLDLPEVTGPNHWLPDDIKHGRFDLNKLIMIAEAFGGQY